MTSTLPPEPATGTGGPGPRSRIRGLLLGRRSEPPWARPALVVLLAATAVLYLYGLGASGWANSFYSAAVQAGATSWKAFFFGSSDAAGAITVDKTPAALWPMALTARISGVGSSTACWSSPSATTGSGGSPETRPAAWATSIRMPAGR